MNRPADHIAHARAVADAILYEGYLLYPYRQSSRKNQARFQFGVLMPPAYAAVDASEPSASQTECLAECAAGARVEILLRFLHVQQRLVQEAAGPARPGPAQSGHPQWRDVPVLNVDGTEFTRFTEATEREERADLAVASLAGEGAVLPFHIEGGETAEDLTDSRGAVAGRLIHRWDTLDGVLRVQGERVAGPYQALRLRVRVENRTEPDPAPGLLATRADGLRYALVAAHTLIGDPGRVVHLHDRPSGVGGRGGRRVHERRHLARAGRPADCHDLMLSSPVILYDHPEIAPESAGDLFDATEIDEILTLRTMALTDEEKREARATDPRAADLIDRLDGLPPEMLEKLHGAIRYLEPSAGPVTRGTGTRGSGEPEPMGPFPGAPAADDVPVFQTPDAPWWDPGADTSVSPETDQVVIDGVTVARGSKVRMRPGARRADAQDLFLIGREALVEAVLHDVDGKVHVAVSPVADPVAELQRTHGRFLYFAPDELEPIGARSPAGMRCDRDGSGPEPG